MQGDLTKPSITVVEDDPCAQHLLVHAAQTCDFDCQSAGCAEEAIELLARRPTPIVITDLNMPGKGGLWLVDEVRRRWPQIAVLVATAESNESAQACLQAGASHYFRKPIRLDEFRQVLDTTWRTRQLERQNELYRAHLERALERKKLKIRKTFLRAIDTLVRAMEERDPCTVGHSRRVQRYSLDLAAALRLDRGACRQLSLAARLHDIGKVGVPEAILNKPGRLTSEEFDRIREHPVVGERILAPIIRNRSVLSAIRGHHERLDGRGYPDALKGDRIPLLARIIAVADCFDALTSARSYRGALTVSEGLEVLRQGAGTFYEPAFVEAFVEVSKFFDMRKHTTATQNPAHQAASLAGATCC